MAGNVGSAFVGVWQELVDGLRPVRGDRAVIALLAVITLAMIGEGNLSVLAIAYVEGVLGYGTREFSWIFAARAFGDLLSGLVVVGFAIRHLSPGKLIAIAGVADGLAVLAMLNAQALPALMILFAVAGLAIVPFYATQQALLQRLVPDEFRGSSVPGERPRGC